MKIISADLNELRNKMDKIDNELVRLFEQRMEVSGEIAHYKQMHNLQIYDPSREQEKIQDLSQKVKKEYETCITALYSLLFKLSRENQERIQQKKD